MMDSKTLFSFARYAVWAFMLLCLGVRTASSAPEYRIDQAESELRVLVFRAGALASFGHNHAIVARELTGTAELGATARESSVKFAFPVASLLVDAAEVRAEEGPDFEGQIAEDDIAATRDNMLGVKLLEAENHPIIRVESTAIVGELPNVTVTASIMLKDNRYMIDVPVSINTFDGGLVAVGRMRLDQTTVGLTPFTAVFGGLRVANQMLIKFRIVARTEDR